MRPQEVINRAIVDQCDLLVGIFWARIGSTTGVAESGTLEEIARVAKAGKSIMLYFSKAGVDPERIDVTQLARLNSFKAEVQQRALTESYKSPLDFRDKFSKQLELKVRDLQKADESGTPAPLLLAVASPDLRSLDESPAIRELVIPDVGRPEDQNGQPLDQKTLATIESQIVSAATTPMVLTISNNGSSGIRNLYVEMSIAATNGAVVASSDPRRSQCIMDVDSVFKYSMSHFRFPQWTLPSNLASNLDLGWYRGLEADDNLHNTEDGWQFSFEWPALQPRRVRVVAPTLYVTARVDAEVKCQARIFADSMPEPLALEAVLSIHVEKKVMELDGLLGEKKPNSTALDRK